MFDIGFWELLVTAVIGLLVLGPERLPQAVRTGSLWLSRLRRSVAELQRDIEREAGVDELKRELHNQRILDSLKESGEELDRARRTLQQTAGEALPYDVSDILRPGADQPADDQTERDRD